MNPPDDRIQRFSRFQILLHWAVGLPYLALAASGAIIMLQRLGVLPHALARLVEQLHRFIGIGLTVVLIQAMFAAIVSGHLPALIRDFADWILIRPREILWLFLVPLNILMPRWVHLPPAGRFNAGQKLHGMFILVALGTFSVTGIWMILHPSDLRPWIVHSWFFFGALGFLALHLFLGLVNPVTRRGLSGIFTGHVPREYIEDHHPLTLEQPPEKPRPHAVVSIKAMLFTWGIALVAAAGVVRWYGPEDSALQVWRVSVLPRFASMSPGPLIAAHADDRRVENCQTCHESMMAPPNSACLKCHDEIKRMTLQKAGYHGRLEGACRDCHTDHKGRGAEIRILDTKTFNHDLARFALKGQHESTECRECHVEHAPARRATPQFIGLAFSSCGDCHENPHAPSLGTDCQRCHVEQGWEGTNLRFDHNRDSDFKIDAIHVGLSCEACHKSAGAAETKMTFRGLEETCAGCHADVSNAMAGQIEAGKPQAADPHNGRVSCTDCHAPAVRSPTPAQFANACVKCHSPAYQTLYFDWAHAIDDRSVAAQKVVENVRPTDPRRAMSLQAAIQQATSVGMHNPQLSIQLLTQISQTESPPTH